jgi:hypothetical protein
MEQTLKTKLESLDPVTQHVIFAAMCSMVFDVHSMQDNMNKEQWDRADEICVTLQDWLDNPNSKENNFNV